LDAEEFSATLLAWYERTRRDLPWRPPLGCHHKIDPYAVLVSELMLQQTQVATVVPYFGRFMSAMPTIADLAAAREQEVLRLWQGLGYYARARNLHAAARKVVAEFGGVIPSSLDELQSLQGVGRYTAGAVASIAFGRRAPIVDGNVARVLCRLELIQTDPRDRRTTALLWNLADEILPRRQAGEFNSAMMELGATVCTPRNPACSECPVREFCKAAAAGKQNVIPLSRKSPPTPLLRRWTIGLRHGRRWLIEQRPQRGRWAGMWQFVTIEAARGNATSTSIGRLIGLRISKLRKLGRVRHALTHRRYVFDVFTAEANSNGDERSGKWVRMNELERYPLPRPQSRIAEMIRAATEPSGSAAGAGA
jgi:A/G-specific adenine glycosylase